MMAGTVQKQAFTCSRCKAVEQVDVYPGVNVASDPQLREKVRDGSLFVWECPHCGTRNLARYPFLYHDPDAKLMVWLLPDGQVLPEAMQEQLETVSDRLDGYTLRRVGDVGSLIEKIAIREADLEDTVIEMVKYVTRMELIEKNRAKEAALIDVPMKFYRMEGPDNEMVLSFPLDGAMHGVHVGFNVYEDCRGILMRNPSVRPDAGFARIDSTWISKFFR